MKIIIDGSEKLSLKGLLGAKSVNIKAVSGDFHFAEIVPTSTSTFDVRDTQATISIVENISQEDGEVTIRVSNADALKVRPKERLIVLDDSDEIVGYVQYKSVEDAEEPNEATHKNLTLIFESETFAASINGLYLLDTLTTDHSIVLLEDSVLEEGDSLENVSSNEYKFFCVKGTGVLEISSLKKKD